MPCIGEMLSATRLDEASNQQEGEWATYQGARPISWTNSRILVLTLAGNSLQLNVRPRFSDQQSIITLESAKNGKHCCWSLDGSGKEKKQVSVEQLSEYLLRPILSSSEID